MKRFPFLFPVSCFHFVRWHDFCMAFHSFPARAFFSSAAVFLVSFLYSFRLSGAPPVAMSGEEGETLEEFAEYHASDEELEQELHSLPFGGYHFTFDQSMQIQDVRPAPGMEPSFFGMERATSLLAQALGRVSAMEEILAHGPGGCGEMAMGEPNEVASTSTGVSASAPAPKPKAKPKAKSQPKTLPKKKRVKKNTETENK